MLHEGDSSITDIKEVKQQVMQLSGEKNKYKSSPRSLLCVLNEKAGVTGTERMRVESSGRRGLFLGAGGETARYSLDQGRHDLLYTLTLSVVLRKD